MCLTPRWLKKFFQRMLLKWQHQPLKMTCSTLLFLLILMILWSWRRLAEDPQLPPSTMSDDLSRSSSPTPLPLSSGQWETLARAARQHRLEHAPLLPALSTRTKTCRKKTGHQGGLQRGPSDISFLSRNGMPLLPLLLEAYMEWLSGGP